MGLQRRLHSVCVVEEWERKRKFSIWVPLSPGSPGRVPAGTLGWYRLSTHWGTPWTSGTQN